MDLLGGQELPTLRSRSIVLSLVILAYKLPLSESDAKQFAEFTKAFVERLQKHVKQMVAGRGTESQHLFEFQKHLSQGSGEQLAIERRHKILEKCYQHWIRQDDLPNDSYIYGDP